MAAVSVPMSAAARNIRCDIAVTITGRRQFELRWWLALKVLKLAAWLMPVRAEIAVDVAQK